MAVRRRTPSVLLLLGLLVSAAGRAPGLPRSELVEYHQAAWPEPDLSVISDRNRDQLEAATELVDFHKGDFAGAYVDQDSQLVVAAASDHGMELATRRFREDPVVRIERRAFSLEAVSRLGDDLYRRPDIARKIYMAAIDAPTGALRVGVDTQLTKADKATIEQFAERNELGVQVYVDEQAVRPTMDVGRY